MTDRLDQARRFVKGVAQNALPFMITCVQFEEFLARHMDGELSPRERFVFRLHLVFCRECRAYVAAFNRARAAGGLAYGDSEDLGPPPEDLVNAVLAARSRG